MTGNSRSIKHEWLTPVLDEGMWWMALRATLAFLREQSVQRLQLHYGFVLGRDLQGQAQGVDGIVEIDQVEATIVDGLRAGIIQRQGDSDFVMLTVGLSFGIMVCNDADIHFASDNLALRNVSMRLRHLVVPITVQRQLSDTAC